MKQFLKIFIAITCSLLLLLFLTFIGLVIYVKNSNKSPALQKEEILVLHFPSPIKEYVKNSKLDKLINKNKELGLFDIEKSIAYAAKDPQIKGILINGKSSLSINHANSLLEALSEFKKTGKFIESYGEYYGQSSYMLSSIADRIVLNPNGRTYIKGYGFINFYLKDFLAKYHVEPHFFVAGKYKSFIEMFSRNESSPENDIQFEEILEGLNQNLDSIIATNRNLSLESVQKIRKEFVGNSVSKSLKAGIIDTLMYKTDYLQNLAKRVNLEEDEAFISINKYYTIIQDKLQAGSKKPEIAIVFAEGEITSQSDQDKIDEARYRNIFNKIRKDKNIKAILLRINSPGGASTASDELWHEVELCKKDSLPVIVSMGSYAASGGYYIAAAADQIFAETTTVTGSIGVFAMLFELEKAMEKNFDIHTDYIRTSPYSLGLNSMVKLTQEQKEMMQGNTDELYEIFKQKVADGRDMTVDQLETLAQGRVYLGQKALNIGLVDQIGTMDDALEYIREKYNLNTDNYSLYPKNEDEIQAELLQLIKNKNPFSTSIQLEKVLGSSLANIAEMEEKNGYFMRMPYFEIK